MSAFLAPCLVALRNEVNTRWPHRDRSSDGWLGDRAHSARVSDHNPDDTGMVHAIDVDTSGINVGSFLKTVIGDPRVWYVIHNRIIYSRTYGWSARRYTGSNPHTGHAHVSVRYVNSLERDTRRWFDSGVKPTSGTPTVDHSNVSGQARKTVKGDDLDKSLPGSKLVQRALNDRLNPWRPLKVDGYLGPRSVEVMKDWQRWRKSHGGRRGEVDGIPNYWDLVTLGRGRFKVRK